MMTAFNIVVELSIHDSPQLNTKNLHVNICNKLWRNTILVTGPLHPTFFLLVQCTHVLCLENTFGASLSDLRVSGFSVAIFLWEWGYYGASAVPCRGSYTTYCYSWLRRGQWEVKRKKNSSSLLHKSFPLLIYLLL